MFMNTLINTMQHHNFNLILRIACFTISSKLKSNINILLNVFENIIKLTNKPFKYCNTIYFLNNSKRIRKYINGKFQRADTFLKQQCLHHAII